MDADPQLPLPSNKSELFLLEALRGRTGEASAYDLLEDAEASAESEGEAFDRTAASDYLRMLADGKVYVDNEVSAALLGTRLYRLRDEYR